MDYVSCCLSGSALPELPSSGLASLHGVAFHMWCRVPYMVLRSIYGIAFLVWQALKEGIMESLVMMLHTNMTTEVKTAAAAALMSMTNGTRASAGSELCEGGRGGVPAADEHDDWHGARQLESVLMGPP